MNLWNRLRTSFWFIPALMCLAAVVVAESLIYVDRRLTQGDLSWLDFIITRVGESGSRDLLGAIAGSMLTVASTTFSITIAVLALSSSTYGPRLVRNFMADRANQFVLGTFVATFLYSLLVLRSIREIGDGDGEYFIPHLAVNIAVLLAVLSIGVLVYFIHHISDSVQVSTLAEQVRIDLRDVTRRLFPEKDADVEVAPPDDLPDRLEADGAVLTAGTSGYVQGIDLEELVSVAQDHDVLIAMCRRPGQHVTKGARVAVVWPPSRFDDEVRDAAREAIHLARARDPHQDVEFPALLLEEMAVRALSPSTNDPYTALNALDDLASGLVELAGRSAPSPYRRDEHGRLRVVVPWPSLLDILDHLLDAMRHNATSHPTVMHRCLGLAEQVGAATSDPAVRSRLLGHTRRLVEAYEATSPHPDDLEALTEHADRVRGELLGLGGTA